MARVDRAADLIEALEEELVRACDLGWRELAKVIPWGDTYDGFTPAGRAAQFERNYLWDGADGGDIRVEVVVFQPDAYEKGARLSRLLMPPSTPATDQST